MDVSIGLPTTVPGITGVALLDFARRADQADFTGLCAVDRLVHDGYEPLAVLAAAAAVTTRIRLASTVLLGSCRGSAAPLAKQLATLDRLSGGRLVVGLAVGDREDDFVAAGVPFQERGRRMDTLVRELRAVWAGEGPAAGVGPRPVRPEGPPLLFGGHSPAAMRRAARYGSGWISGGSSGTAYRELVGRARQAWADEGRTQPPRVVSLCYVSLGPEGRRHADEYLHSYYAYIGTKARQAASRAVTDGRRLRDVLAEYADAGCDEIVLFPCSADPEQVDLVAGAVW
ncbi:LLM class flavin-dependent oxidoreductase [Streptomyces sioyaensis]|uniref:LLM class flavin-dependent oxidoreductase n=1 Tax=Streptomyces sioyaensis TaxID=67364 RepID=UPI001F461081|nr:LLM class flavin-dependent oxidoreductase [Streptomyces sioyaensis]MCF3175826.1 LLM class flavin-dependent oxidoreductase [Streptomyces sioyaensis]